MDPAARRVLATLFVVIVGLVVAGLSVGGKGLSATAQELPEIGEAQRAAGLAFAPAVAESDRAWVLEAVARARPEAQALIAEADGLVEVATHRGLPIGVTQAWRRGGEARYRVSLDTFLLNGRRMGDRDVVVLHELGHVVDHALVGRELNDRLDQGIPRTGTCVQDAEGLAGSCTEPVERFADTFAKWALRGSVSKVGAGYGVATPVSLEDWGAPLAARSRELARGD
jgi:hypothetical protein